MIKIHALQCGTVGTDETIPDKSKSKNPLAYTGLFRGERHRVRLPVYCYLIEHPKGRILVDTGWHTDVRTNQREHLSWKLNLASKAYLPKGEAISEQLSRMGLSPKDIDIVLLTHMDVDHASGLQLVKDAKKICANPAEIEAVVRGDVRYNKNLWKNIKIKAIPMKNYSEFPNGRAFDVFGDKTVMFVDFSGHSAGMTGVFIENNGRFVILTGDACYNRENWEQLKLPGLVVDKEKAMRSIKWISAKSKEKGCVEILASHDPEVKPHMTEL